MSNIVETATFAPVDNNDHERLTLSLLVSGGVLIAMQRAGDVIYHATIPRPDWQKMINLFEGLDSP